MVSSLVRHQETCDVCHLWTHLWVKQFEAEGRKECVRVRISEMNCALHVRLKMYNPHLPSCVRSSVRIHNLRRCSLLLFLWLLMLVLMLTLAST